MRRAKSATARWIRKPLSASDRDEFPIVAIGASAGGLDPCKKLFDALSDSAGLAFIVVQHLDPNHDSLLVDLLSAHTSMTVSQAVDGIEIQSDHVYIIPPGVYLSVDSKGLLRLSKPAERHGARLPFDFLLNSLATTFAPRTIAVILSGNGSDGSVGLKAIKSRGGVVIAQLPSEAEYEGMPLAAIATGAVDHVLPAQSIAAAIIEAHRRILAPEVDRDPPIGRTVADLLPDFIALLRGKTNHDFSLYKYGTIERRVARRIAMRGIPNAEDYLTSLKSDMAEIEELSRDLLINVTEFFRDGPVFKYLEETVIPDLLRNHAQERPLRVWVAGCSSGEETYSIAMILREQAAALKRPIKLQIFASDVDPDAVGAARDGLYPKSIEANVSAERLARHFLHEGESYRIVPELRAIVVFAVHDILSDPPFAGIDFISCRNLLIYLQPEAQARTLAIFHFALRENGVLLVGKAETVGTVDGQFSVQSKPERVYRRTGQGRAGELSFSHAPIDGTRMRVRPEPPAKISRQASLAELCRRLVSETYGPATVLVNAKLQSLHFQGPTDLYFRVASGRPSLDVMNLAREDVRSKLRAALTAVQSSRMRTVVSGGRLETAVGVKTFRIEVEPVVQDGETLFWVCFVDDGVPPADTAGAAAAEPSPRVEELERELRAVKIERQNAIRDLETTSEEQMAINEEALSINEEYQSTNEELLASKEELQSLNEELTALNSQLQETLERQRTTADDLQNVLYSTDVATIFLDDQFNIRFFTPATKAMFNLIPGDIGRPLTDLNSAAVDGDLIPDAQAVLLGRPVKEREVQGHAGIWYVRRVLPYRTRDQKTEGVVITFEDVTERRKIGEALSVAKRQAESASLAKSRFLAAASHDLRQPLQTLALLQALLAKKVEGEKAQKLVERIDEAIGAMTNMLNTLLDINQIEVGAVKAEQREFSVNELLGSLSNELSYHAQAVGLVLKVLPCDAVIRSDPRLLEQMMRNLVANAIKYTLRGRVLVGCRRRAGSLRIEVWDTGLGIEDSELQAIFEEYHQVDNPARQRSLGLGLGLSIVKSLGQLLGHTVRVRSILGKGSVFSIEVPRTGQTAVVGPGQVLAVDARPTQRRQRQGIVLVIEDDPAVREHLTHVLKDEGFTVSGAFDGDAALQWLKTSAAPPDLVLADYNLPNGMNGVDIALRMRRDCDREIPFIILTGDITTEALRNIALHDCVQFNKPIRIRELTQAIDKLLAHPVGRSVARPAVDGSMAERTPSKIYIVDDDDQVREALRVVLEDDGREVEAYASCETFLEAYAPGDRQCLLIDAYLPGISGLELLKIMKGQGRHLPAIMITGNSDVGMAVLAMKAGASDFIEKPIGRDELVDSIDRALELSGDADKRLKWRESAASHLSGLTQRQREVMERVLAGHPSKNIAADLGISQRTVENHRASIMKRTGAKSLPALARLALVAVGGESAASVEGAPGQAEVAVVNVSARPSVS